MYYIDWQWEINIICYYYLQYNSYRYYFNYADFLFAITCTQRKTKNHLLYLCRQLTQRIDTGPTSISLFLNPKWKTKIIEESERLSDFVHSFEPKHQSSNWRQATGEWVEFLDSMPTLRPNTFD